MSSLTKLTAQGEGSTGVVSLGRESNPSQESDSRLRVTMGYAEPFWMDRQETVNPEVQEPKLYMFTSLLQVMSSHYKKLQSSEAQSFRYCPRG